MNRQTGLHFVVPFAVKLPFDIGRGLRLNAVDRFVDNSQAYFRVRRRRTVVVARQNCVGRHVARLELFFIWNNVELQHLVARGHGQQLALVVHIAVFDERDIEIHVRFILVFDGHVDDDTPAGDVDLAHGHHLGQFRGHQQMRVIGRQHGQHVRNLAGFIRLLVGH